MNNFARALAALGLLWANAASAQYAATVLADSPIAYYRFEEPSGTTATDSSGNGNNGTYTAGPALGQPGQQALGLAVRFDGVDDYVDTPRSVSGSFTLEMWLASTAACPGGTEAYQGDGLLWSDVGGVANDFVLGCLNNVAAFFTGNPDNTIQATTPLNDGRWHHVVVTRSITGTKQVYVDGVLQASGATNTSPLDANARIAVGGNVLDDRYFTGLIDEVAYYPTVLSAARIQAHFAAGSVVATASVPSTGTTALAALLGALLLVGMLRLRRAA